MVDRPPVVAFRLVGDTCFSAYQQPCSRPTLFVDSKDLGKKGRLYRCQRTSVGDQMRMLNRRFRALRSAGR